MNRVIVDLIALLLPPCDREAVLGDLAESSAPLASSLMAILGFALRRQFLCWLSWRPWFAAIALAYTTTWLLMGSSVEVNTNAVNWCWGAVSWHHVPYRLTDFTLSLLRLFAAAWSAGFAAARISQQNTLGQHAVTSCPLHSLLQIVPRRDSLRSSHHPALAIRSVSLSADDDCRHMRGTA